MARMGMDVDAVESIARAIQGDADRLGQLTANVEALVRKLPGLWDGADATRFVQEWWPQHRKTLTAVQESVRGLGQSALNNAAEQRQASGTGAAPVVTGTAAAAAGTAAAVAAGSGSPSVAEPAAPVASAGEYNAGILAAAQGVPDGAHGGQCAIFAEDMIRRAGGPSVALGMQTSGYQDAWARHSTEQTWATAAPGDVIQWYDPANGNVHTAILAGGNSEQTATVVDSNYGFNEKVHSGTFESRNNFGANNYKIWRVNH